MNTDVAIIGGGIVGCATAYNLARAGLAVTLIERGAIAGEQSSRAWGFVRQQGRHEAEIGLAALASEMWETLGRELQADLEFVRGGILVPAETDDDMARFEHSATLGARAGLSTRMLTPGELAAQMPELAGRWKGALYTAEDAHAEPRKTTEAFAHAAERLGARLLPNTVVTGIETTAGAATAVLTRTGAIKAGAVLCATGIGTSALLRPLGIDLPIQPVRTAVCETEEIRHFTRTAVWGPDASFRPTQHGTFYIGTGYRHTGTSCDISLDTLRHIKAFWPTYRANRRLVQPRFGRESALQIARSLSAHRFDPLPEPLVDQALTARIKAAFTTMLPGLSNLGIRRAWAGRIDMTPDVIPIIGAAAEIRNLYVAAGFSGHGFALGPATGRLLAELIRTGRPSLDLSPFRLSRFAEGAARYQPHAL